MRTRTTGDLWFAEHAEVAQLENEDAVHFSAEPSLHQSVCGQKSGVLVANHLANAAFTAVGFSCAIQCPDWTTTSVRSVQSCRIGSAKRDVTVWHV